MADFDRDAVIERAFEEWVVNCGNPDAGGGHSADRAAFMAGVSTADLKLRVNVIEGLLNALGLTDDTSEADARQILGGCDCNGEEGTAHLIWHLRRMVVAATLAPIEALHRPITVTSFLAACEQNRCDHESDDDCPEIPVEVCGHCYGLASDASDEVTYLSGETAGMLAWPCPTAQAIADIKAKAGA